jgi:DNA-binding CsgD family transcriptional regulator
VNSSQLTTRLLSAAYTLSDTSTLTELRQGSAQLLSSCIGCDEVLWTELDVVTPAATVHRGPKLEADAALADSLGRYGDQHPAVASYLQPGDDRYPRRVSDVTSQRAWSTSAAYREVFGQDGTQFQLSLVVSLARGVGRGWVLTRSSTDFADRNVETAAQLLPLLVGLHNVAQHKFAAPTQAPPSPLTGREVQVLQLLATGRTALAIGRTMGISEATVRKHIQHIFNKMNCDNRLTAVMRARDLGMIHTKYGPS